MKGEVRPIEAQRACSQLLTVSQVSREYSIGRTTLYELLATGELPAVVLRKRGTRVRREDVETWIGSLPRYRPMKDR
jgi:excisionase family DNA binding protein